jgi:hypothetical protein
MAMSGLQLVRYDTMCRAIDAAYEVDEVKQIRAEAVALEAYAKQAKNTEAERRACEIRLRAERKAGQLLKQAEKAKAAPGPGRGKKGPASRVGAFRTAPTLKQLGISEKQSSNWQKLGAVPQAEFDAAVDAAEKPTTNGIIRATSKPKVYPVAREALWLWGRLNDFSEMLLTKEPAAVMRTMTVEMKDEVHVLAPRVATWLKRIGAVS